MNPSYEYRAAPGGIEIREAPAGFLATIAGIAAPFDSDSKPFAGNSKPWVERIARGAFTRTLRENRDVLGLYSHDNNKPLARTPKTLTLSDSGAGLGFIMKLADTSVARDLVSQLRAGVINGMSFAFSAVKTAWKEGTEYDTRTLLDVDLHEISPVTWPAYPATNVAERSHQAFMDIREICPDLQEVMEERNHFLYGDGRTPLRDYWAAKLAALEQ